MNNNFYITINFIALCTVCSNIANIDLLGYAVSCVLMWNVIEGFREVKVVR